MREIKFRAWNSKRSEMLFLGNLTDVNWDMRFIFKNLAVMQYTGLKDKNGIEAYQDDLYRPWDDDRIYQIVWKEDEAAFVLKQVAGRQWPCQMLMIPYGDGGIIGNIYQNPDLIGITNE